MRLAGYVGYDALGLAALVGRADPPSELAVTAAPAIAALNPKINAVVELYPDRIEGLDEAARRRSVSRRAVPDQGHRRASRRPQGRVRQPALRGHDRAADTYPCGCSGGGPQHHRPLERARILDVGHHRERALRQHLHTLARGLSAGGSTGGGGRGRRRHGADGARLGHRRLDPHAGELCGGVGLKPSRGRVSLGPLLDEGGWGLARISCRPRPSATRPRCSTASRCRSPAIPS